MDKKEINFDERIGKVKIDTMAAEILIHSDGSEKPRAILNGKFDVEDNPSKVTIKEGTTSTVFKTNGGTIRIGKVTINSNTAINGIVSYSDNVQSKSLEVILPKNSSNLSLVISTMSGNLTISNLFLEKLVVDSISGNITLKEIDFFSAKIDTMSGNVTTEINNSMQNFKTRLDTMSGKIEKEDVEDYSKNNSSNMNMNVNSNQHSLKVDTMSGDIKVLFKGRKR